MALATSRLGEPPSPHGVRTYDELVARLRQLRAWAGLGYHEVHRRVVDLRQPRGIPERLVYNTVYRCFQPGRSRLDVELVVDIARVLLGAQPQADALAAQWRVAYQVVAGLASEAEIVTVSWSIPDDLAGFTGRTAELDQVLRAADAGDAVTAISGMAGVGKTQLAIHAAQRLLRQGRFADLQVWVNLRGHDPDRPPADPAAVLGAFLRGLGVPGDQIYHLDLAARTARFRELLAGRRALVVLDNAASEQQVRPLLPDTAGSLTLVTSRRSIDLPAARRLRLDVFGADEAVELLRRTAGAARIDADPGSAARIAELVGNLPLALGLVASRITRSADWTLADHLARLAERTRHRRLEDGVELALHTSYAGLRPPARRLLRLLALHPGGDLDGYAAAALAGAELAAARDRLDELLAGNLLQQKAHGRYEFHDLVRLYAVARAVDDEPDSARREALTRLLDHYLATAAAAVDALYPGQQRTRVELPGPPPAMPPVADPARARAWLEAERTNLLAAVAWAAGNGRPAHTCRIATTLARHLDIAGHYGDAIAIHRHALEAARQLGDRDGEGTAHGNLGIAYWRVSRNDEAIAHSRQAVAAFRGIGDRAREALAQCNLGLVHERMGRYERATDHYRQALEVFREVGHRAGEGATLNNLAVVYSQLGRYDDAIEHNRLALAIRREQDDRAGEALVLCNIGGIHSRTGRHAEATEHHRQALAICREIGFRNGEAYALTSLGSACERVGRFDDAVDYQRQALAIALETDETELEVDVRNSLGQALRATGRAEDALHQHEAALAVAGDAGIRLGYARAHDGIAHVMQATGRPDLARQHWREALAVYADLGAPEAAEIRANLAAVEPVAAKVAAAAAVSSPGVKLAR